MKKSQNSSTALGTAAMRAIESERPANMRICYDPYARYLTDKWFYLLIKLFAWYGERYTRGALTFIVCRYRYIDEYLQECLKSGITQLVILGAGLDSRAYRKELFQKAIRIIEVDFPPTQKRKIKQLKRILGKLPPNVTYIPIDFNNEKLDKLFDYNFDQTVKTLFIWEGVTFYLNLKAVDATLTWIKKNTAIGGTIIFDYQYQSSTDQEQTKQNFLYSMISRLSGEKRVFGIKKGQIKEFLIQRGFTNVVDTNAKQLTRLYCTNSNRNRKVAENYAIVHAEVE